LVKVVDIIPIIDGYLYSVKYDDEYDSEFDRLLELWNDPEYVDEYFETNKKFLYTEFWMQRDGLTLKNRIPEQAEHFENKILEFEEILNPDNTDEEQTLDDLFQPLGTLEYERTTYQPSKGKNDDYPFCLRLYAVRLHAQQYVITGGAIKLTQEMKDHPDTKLELQKLNMVKEYLLDQFDHDFTPDLREL